MAAGRFVYDPSKLATGLVVDYKVSNAADDRVQRAYPGQDDAAMSPGSTKTAV